MGFVEIKTQGSKYPAWARQMVLSLEPPHKPKDMHCLEEAKESPQAGQG